MRQNFSNQNEFQIYKQFYDKLIRDVQKRNILLFNLASYLENGENVNILLHREDEMIFIKCDDFNLIIDFIFKENFLAKELILKRAKKTTIVSFGDNIFSFDTQAYLLNDLNSGVKANRGRPLNGFPFLNNDSISSDNFYEMKIDRPFTCPYKNCQSAFKRAEHLKRHQKIHTGEKKFVCPYPNCDKRFARNDNKNQHYKLHFKNGTFPYKNKKLPFDNF